MPPPPPGWTLRENALLMTVRRMGIAGIDFCIIQAAICSYGYFSTLPPAFS